MHKLFALPLAVLLCVAAPASAEPERILDYRSDVRIQKDGWLLVTETIKVHSEGRRIRHGIYRDFPMMYRGAWFTRKSVPFEVLDVQRDGAPEDYDTKPQNGGRRVRIGNPNRTLKPGDYTYTLQYKTSRQIGFFEDHDELMWNVTGTGWEFPIERATARVVPPPGVSPEDLQLEAYTGRPGQKGQDFETSVGPDGAALFSATRTLKAGETITVVVSWPKGYVDEAAAAYTSADFLLDNFGLVIGVGGLVAVFGYYLGAWVAVGRDPPSGAIIPRFEPPKGLSPAAARYVMEMGYDERCFSAALVSMAAKGYIAIEQDDGEYTLRKVPDAPTTDLSAEEKAVARALLRRKSEVVLRQENHARVRKAMKKLKEKLATGLEKRYFVTNRAYLVPGIVISAAALIAGGVMMRPPDSPLFAMLFICVWLAFWTVGVGALLTAAKAQWQAALAGGPGSIVRFGGAVFITLFSIPFLAAEVAGLGFLALVSSVWTVVLLLLLLVLNLLFYELMKAPTYAGRRVMDEVEGFRMYLNVAERDRLDSLAAPERTPELFERFLPYALALGVENRWAEQFSTVLEEAGGKAGTYSPAWYTGTGLSSIGAGGLASSLGSSLSGALSTASTAPGSSSGMGGGGSSGGGGGGGGGGGW